jgi:hypothetical protein
MQPTITCKNCGNHFHGKFCNQCGEKVYSQKDKSIENIFEEAFHFLTHFDGTFFTTLKTFFSRPGKMSREYVDGHRKKYFKPVSLFLVMVIAYLLFPRFQGLNMKFSTYVSEEYDYAWYALPVARQKIHAHHITGKELAKLYDEKSPGFAKICLLLLLPLSAIVLSVIFFTSKKYFFDHFILSTEIMAFHIFLDFLFMPFLSVLTNKFAPAYDYLFNDGTWLWKVLFVIFGIFIAIAFRNFYKQRTWLCVLKVAVFLFVFGAGIRYVYNAILYLLVMLFV